MGAAVETISPACVDQDFAAQNFLQCLLDPEQWDSNIYESYERVSSSHQLGTKQQK